MSGGSFAKRDREKKMREKAALKQEKRAQRRAEDTPEQAPVSERSQADVLAALAALHQAHGDGKMEFEEFEVAKADLLAQLQL